MYVEVFRHLLLQGAHLEDTLRQTMMRMVGTALDRACLVGAGTSGAPLGIGNTAGIDTASVTALAWSGVLSARVSALQTCGSDQAIKWIGGSVAQRVLAGHEPAAGPGFIWDYGAAALDDTLAGRRAFATYDCPIDALYLGDWSRMLVGQWGHAVTLEYKPCANFQSGIVGFRVILPCAVAVISTAFFSAVTAIT